MFLSYIHDAVFSFYHPLRFSMLLVKFSLCDPCMLLLSYS